MRPASYTGEEYAASRNAARAQVGGPYAYKLTDRNGTRIVDAACRRGAAAYANSSHWGSGTRSNAHTKLLTILAADRFGPPLSAQDPEMADPPRRIQNLGMRRFPRSLVRLYRDRSTLYVVAVRPIPPNTEIIFPYRAAAILRMRHSTTPRPC